MTTTDLIIWYLLIKRIVKEVPNFPADLLALIVHTIANPVTSTNIKDENEKSRSNVRKTFFEYACQSISGKPLVELLEKEYPDKIEINLIQESNEMVEKGLREAEKSSGKSYPGGVDEIKLLFASDVIADMSLASPDNYKII